ncbi:MAG: hypothetical protein OM95_16735 [Bdellovibrio sp. ArHS]|uniref:pilus assembly FimT family protein n=1 Tax=Bdellovibrio sp. ArHS TaxID=1569284 RepID=UPI0005836C72|nr:prepilin-type N-terminal cleavage/methylation domain-containing protein [Bdellovibrio sp. ArHS]KHD87026.1 MAG: hypothetical protein OM95_16735 [Bdellovibrio sp. ArHS]
MNSLKRTGKLGLNRNGFTLLEIIIAAGVMAILILFTTPLLTLVINNFQKRMQSDSNTASRMHLKKYFNRSLMAVSPVRFDPSATLVGNSLNSTSWKLSDGRPITKDQVPTFLLDGRPVRQDSFSIELYSIEYKDGKATKVSYGALLSRCAKPEVHDIGISVSALNDLARPYLQMKDEECCQGGVCKMCRNYSISCCDSSQGSCEKDVDLLPMVFVINKDQIQIYPAKPDLLTTPGIGFMLSFDANPVRSYTLYEFRYMNRCLLSAGQKVADCSKDVRDYFQNAQFKPFLQLEVSSTTSNVVNSLSDGSFIGIGEKVLGDF